MSDWVSYGEAARQLGISKTTLKRRIAAGHIRIVRPAGGRPRIARTELAAYRAAAEAPAA